jgi:hypothetical protein
MPYPFIWCNVTTLVPKPWHEQIGGFDERMKSWEDVEYHCAWPEPAAAMSGSSRN